MIAAKTRLDVMFHLIQRDGHTLAVRCAHPFVAADERGKRNALGGAEGGIPARAVFQRADGLALRVGVFSRRLMAHKLLATHWMLAVGEPCEVFFGDFAGKSPLRGKPAMPLAAYLIALGVVILAGV